MSQLIDLGRLRFYFTGPYNASTPYEMNDVVTYGGISYVYVNPFKESGNTPPVATHWSKLVEGVDFRGDWTTSTQYYVNDIVKRGGSTYIAKTVHTSNVFETDLTNEEWESLTRGIRNRGPWATATAYLVDDVVTDNLDVYICLDDHTSGGGLFSAEPSGRWQLLTQGSDYLPAQLGNSGALLTTDGTDPSWANSVNVSGTMTVGEVPILVGDGAGTFASSLTNPMGVITIDSDLSTGEEEGQYAQFAIQNTADVGGGSSTDFIAYADVGTDSAGWVDMGITGTGFTDPTFGVTGAHDGYIFMSAPTGTTGAGNLVLATDNTGVDNHIVLAAGGLESGTEQMIVKPTGIDVIGDINSQGELNVAGTGLLTIGDDAQTFRTNAILTNPVAVFSVDENEYAQVSFVNINNGPNASADYIAYADNGDDNSGWIDMGITSSGFSDPEFTSTGPNDGYIFMEAPEGTTGKGNLVIATGGNGTENKIIFAAGGLLSDNEQMSITPDANVHIEIATQSNSPTSGALTVVGGVGVQGNLFVQGNANIDGSITIGGGQFASENLKVTDPLVFVGDSNAGDTLDLGIVGEYRSSISITAYPTNVARSASVVTVDTSAAHGFREGDSITVTFGNAGADVLAMNGSRTVLAVTDSDTFTFEFAGANITSTAVDGDIEATERTHYNGVVRDATDGVFKVFDSLDEPPTTAVNFTDASLANLKASKVYLDAAITESAQAATKAYADSVVGNPWTTVTSNTTLAVRDRVFVDASNGGKVITLPAVPSLGDFVKIVDVAGVSVSNNITVARNGNKIMSLNEDLIININSASIDLVYSGATHGWRIV